MKADQIKITMFPTVNLQEQHNIKALIKVLTEERKLLPEKWGYDERIKINYDEEEMIKNILFRNEKFNNIFLYRNKKAIKYNCFFIAKKSYRSFFKLDFNKSLSKKYWEDFFKLSDEIASIIKPRFGTTVIWSNEVEIDEDNKGIFQHMLKSRSEAPVSFLPDGPLGVSLRTYFNEEIINLFGREFLLNTPAYVKELKWGGIRIDLVKEPWNIDMKVMFDSWRKVMKYLNEANVFSEYIYNGEGYLGDIITTEKWKKFISQL
ncbi:hypothetical protein DVW08_16780 [Clostridium botulinum]|uniref:hypothetical protein n=1 Tax=Clostridium sp. ZBS13 TaxID=2949971 RepID=UPI001E17385E|nr:hypothetical protein [Clostridium sp. ZBS13]MBN1046989.1 hypothetical protein [Clostridium botulinum]